MPKKNPSRRDGYVAGLYPSRVRRLFAAAVGTLPERFTRSELRQRLKEAGAPTDGLHALEAAFMRALAPQRMSHGTYELPPDALLIVDNAQHRLPAVRLDVASVLILNRLLRAAQQAGERLTPRLEQQLELGEALERQLRGHRG